MLGLRRTAAGRTDAKGQVLTMPDAGSKRSREPGPGGRVRGPAIEDIARLDRTKTRWTS